MRGGRSKEHQSEISGLSDPDDLAKAALDYLNKRRMLKHAQDEAEAAKKLLVIEFQAAGKKALKVAGSSLTYMHKENDSIVVKEG